MKRQATLWIIFFAAIICLAVFPCQRPAIAAPAVGGVLPDIALSPPSDRGDRQYLGVSGFGTFKIPQIKAQALIIEIFSMYCPYCQKEAPKVNALHQKIEANPAFKGKIKLIGIGAGNTAFEVDTFRKKYSISFPLFADPEFKIYEKLGQLRTPYFIGVKIGADGSHQIFFSKLGAFEDVDTFLASMIKLSGIK